MGKLKHGHRLKKRSKEYCAWEHMRQRCNNPKHPYFNHYGGRGISVCERWNSYENFLADMGLAPSSKHSLDRINNDGNYEPGNCRWATNKQQTEKRIKKTWSDIKAFNKEINRIEGKISLLKELKKQVGADISNKHKYINQLDAQLKEQLNSEPTEQKTSPK